MNLLTLTEIRRATQNGATSARVHVQVENATLGTVVDGTTIREVPLTNRNYTQVLTLSAAVGEITCLEAIRTALRDAMHEESYTRFNFKPWPSLCSICTAGTPASPGCRCAPRRRSCRSG